MGWNKEELKLKLGRFLLSDSLKNDTATVHRVHALIILWTITSTVMWAYVAYCYSAYGLNIVTIVGAICSFLHTLSLLVYKVTSSFTITGINLSLTGLCFQVMFCMHSGGIFSPAAIWLTLHPVILAFFGNHLLILASVLLNFFVVMGMYFIGYYGVLPPDTLPDTYRDMMIISSYVGLDVLVAAFTVVALGVNREKEQRLEESKNTVENLVRVLCHDINNPLAIIKITMMRLEMLEKKMQETNPLSPEIVSHILRIKTANSQIESITKSVNQWMSNKDNKIAFSIEKISSKEVEEHLIFSFSAQLSKKNLSLNFYNEANREIYFYADRTAALIQVFNNLISNAIKFSYENSSIDVSFCSYGKNFIAKVRDHGVGIDSDLMHKVFSPHMATTKAGTQNEKGTGFGLPIVKTIIEKLDGNIYIENMANITGGKEQGTRLVVEFPLAS